MARPHTSVSNAERWPALAYREWKDTYETLHMWTQIVGKVRLAWAPPLNHWWNVPLYVNACGLTTSPIADRAGIFEIVFDFHDHELRVETDNGDKRSIALAPRTVADFYRELMSALKGLGHETRIWPMPVEVASTIRFDEDTVHAAYDAEQVSRFWRMLVEADRVLKEFRARFVGKASPVHFFWGGFDLAVTRFSGRPAPPHPGGAPNVGAWVMREAYSHEVSSVGLWFGNEQLPDTVFYSYGYPEPPGYPSAPVAPEGAGYSLELKEFLLTYDRVRATDDPDAALLAFCQTTYEAAANLGSWDRNGLERAAITGP